MSRKRRRRPLTPKERALLRRKRKRRRLILILAELLVLAVLGVAAFVVLKLDLMNYNPLNEKNLDIYQDTGDYTNIALFGLDSREGELEKGARSDSIIIASINNKTKEVKLLSVYRDTLLKQDDDTYDKANSAYFYGGPEAAIALLNRNLDLDIKEYVCVDWAAVVEVIDDLGGLDLNITQGEMNQINKYKKDVDGVTGKNTPNVTQYGLVHLDGTQATTYARIRKLSGDDFKRASRQRIVLQAMLEKAKKANPATLVKICNSVVDDISTTLSLDQMVSLAKDVTKYKISSTTGFPTDLTTKNMPRCGDTVIPADLVTNVKKLHEYMFDDATYTPSQTVQAISDTIVNTTGITADSAKINTSDYNETVGATGTDEIQKGSETTGGTNVQ